MQKILGTAVLALTASVTLAAITTDGDAVGPATPQSLSAVLESVGGASAFSSAAEWSGLDARIDTSKPWTVFVPSDRALAREGSAFLLEQTLVAPENAARLEHLLSYHIVPGVRFEVDGSGDDVELGTAAGQAVALTPVANAWRVDGHAAVVESLHIGNGVVHVVDRLLWPTDWSSLREG